MRIQVNQIEYLRNYEYAFSVVTTMKTEKKKVPRNFRLEPEIERELSRRSELTGISETRIVEDALRFHFAANMRRALTSVIAAFGKGSTSNPNKPLAPFSDNALIVTLA